MTITLGTQITRKVIKCPNAPMSWRLKNMSRPSYIFGYLSNQAARLFSKITGIPCLIVKRTAVVFYPGGAVDYRVLGYRVVTTAFVNFMVDQLQAETSQWGDFKYHDSGVGTTAAVVGDTDMETTDGESRATGTQTEGSSANIYKSVGTIAYTSSKAITESGLFSQATGSTLLDRDVFAAINVINGTSIEFTVEFTVTAGG